MHCVCAIIIIFVKNYVMERIITTRIKLLNATSTEFVRYIYDKIDWNARMFGVVGPRGVGKTTLFLQHIKMHKGDRDTIYASADSTYFTTHTLIDFVDDFSKQGGKYVFIDEIHKYPNWSKELKEIYDSFPEMHLAFTGSSILDINKGSSDLSRRAPLYYMQGLSFREYLNIFHGIKVPVYTLEEILERKVEIHELPHPLPLFKDYLRRGYYPFGMEAAFDIELEQVINRTIEIDIPQYADMNISTSRKIKKLLSVIAKSVPFKPVMQTIAEIVAVSRNNLADYFVYLESAGMISQLRDDTGGIRGLGKIEKVYLDNTNLIYILGKEDSDMGNLRETFFYNQLRVNHDIVSSRISDFQIAEKTFEIGEKNKAQKQIKNVPNSYVVKDDIEYAYSNIIPLWFFGLNY